MRHLLRIAASLAVLLLVAPRDSCAGVGHPNVTLSGTRINLVGWKGAASDPLNAADSMQYGCKLTVRAYDVNNNPAAGVPVVLDFSGCASDIRIASTQSYHGETVNCATLSIQNYTGLDGRVSFVVIGGLGSRTGHPAGCLKVYGDTYLYLIGSLGVGAYDQNDIGGMTLGDVSLFWADCAAGGTFDRSDLNGDGFVSLTDISFAWAALAHPFDRSAVVLCP